MNKDKLRILFISLTLLTLVLLVIGVATPMITLKLNAAVDAGIVKFDNPVIDTTRSILGTSKNLFDKKRYLVAFLIYSGSVIMAISGTFRVAI